MFLFFELLSVISSCILTSVNSSIIAVFNFPQPFLEQDMFPSHITSCAMSTFLSSLLPSVKQFLDNNETLLKNVLKSSSKRKSCFKAIFNFLVGALHPLNK